MRSYAHVDPDVRMSIEEAYMQGALGQRIFSELEALAPEGAMPVAAGWLSRIAAEAARLASVTPANLSENGWAAYNRVVGELAGELPALVTMLGSGANNSFFAQIVADAVKASEARLALAAVAGSA